MKRTLLLLLLVWGVAAAWSQPKFSTILGENKNMPMKHQEIHPDQTAVMNGGTVIGQKAFDNTIIGSTWYDSQTVNWGNVMQRIWAYPDGTIGATWMSAGENLIPERGAGYNYFDGNDWGTPDPHVGPEDRMGWPSYAPWGPEGEIISLYRYIEFEGPIKFYKRPVKGTGEWIETELVNPAGVSLVWHSMITSGEENQYIHLLALTYDTPYQGQTNALLYYRSSDGAETWDIDGVVIDGLGSDYLETINALSYAWANPVGETIAFTYGFDEFGGWVFKSDDNGDNWNMIEVFDSPIDPFNQPTDSPILPCGIGTSACALDSQGNAHVVFPRNTAVWITGTLYHQADYTDGLIYWKEGMPVIDTTLISSYTMEYLYNAGNLIGWVLSDGPYTIPDDQPDYANGLCAFPQISIDAEDNIFVAASNLAPGYDNGTYMYRHIVISSSFNGGDTWNEPVDVNDDTQYIFSECAYPEMAPVIGDDIHLVFQEDALPGTNQWPTTPSHPAVNNNIMYMTIPKDFFVGITEKPEQNPVNVSVYPNPVTDHVFLNFSMKEAGMVSAELISQTGQRVVGHSAVNYAAGYHQITLNVEGLPGGIYYCIVTVNDQQVTKKIMVR